jgi:hypothetical protein
VRRRGRKGDGGASFPVSREINREFSSIPALPAPARIGKSIWIKSLRENSRSGENREIFGTNREKNRPNREIREIAE